MNGEPAKIPSSAAPAVSAGFLRRVTLTVAIAVFAMGFVLLTWFAWRIWFVSIAGILLAVLLCTIAGWATRFLRIPHPWSVVLVVVLLVVLFGGGGYLLSRPISQQAEEIQQQLPKAIDQVGDLLQRMGINIQFAPSSSTLTSMARQWVSQIAGLFKLTFETIALALVFLFLGLYLSLNPKLYFQGFLDLFPLTRRQRLTEVFNEVHSFLQYWLLGQLISMTAIGIMVGFGLYFVGVPFPLVLGILAGILDFIPVFGPILAAIPAILLGFLHAPMVAVYAIVVFVVTNQIESHLLVPWIHRYTVSLPPALTVFALALMGTLFGFWGLLLAAPITVICMVLVKRLYVEDGLNAHRHTIL